MKEVWKDIEGYEGKYQVSTLGRVRNARTDKIRKLQPNKKDGYIYLTLCRSKIDQKKVKVHRLSAFAFIENPLNKPFVDHIDGNKHNNNVENLRWVTFQENITAAWETGLYHMKNEMHPHAKLKNVEVVRIRELLKTGMTCKEISVIYNVGRNAINDIKQGRTWTHLK